jgi:GH24 family phage-related lysozyme (muramidase)
MTPEDDLLYSGINSRLKRQEGSVDQEEEDAEDRRRNQELAENQRIINAMVQKAIQSQERPTHVSEEGKAFMKEAEGHGKAGMDPNAVYDDGKGNLTAGWGHMLTPDELKKYKEGDIVPIEVQNAWFDNDVAGAEAKVNSAITNPNITQSQFDALADLAYNSRGFAGSHLVQYVNEGHYGMAALEFEDWNAEKWRGLDTRRANEQRLFSNGNYAFSHNLHTTLWSSTNPASNFYAANAIHIFRALIRSVETETNFNQNDY